MRDIIVDYVTNLDEEKVIFAVKKALKKNIPPKDILTYLQEGMKNVGILFEKEEYFLSDLIMAGIIYKEVLKLDEIKTSFASMKQSVTGKILIGTIQDDVHDIGKDIFIGMAVSEGFNVVDLGVDVGIDTFIDNIKKHQPDIFGISCLLTNAYNNMIKLLTKLHDEGLRHNIKVIIGGIGVQKIDTLSAELQADAYVSDAEIGIEYCKSWMREKHE